MEIISVIAISHSNRKCQVRASDPGASICIVSVINRYRVIQLAIGIHIQPQDKVVAAPCNASGNAGASKICRVVATALETQNHRDFGSNILRFIADRVNAIASPK